jgi:hypothetical protein
MRPARAMSAAKTRPLRNTRRNRIHFTQETLMLQHFYRYGFIKALIGGFIIVLAAIPAFAEIKINPGPVKGANSVRESARGTVWCEVIAVTGTTPEDIAEIYNSSPVDDCTEAVSDKLDTAKLAAEMRVPAVRLNTGRYWTFDKMTLFRAGEVIDFGPVKAQWAGAMTLQGIKNILDSKPYTSALIMRDTEWLYRMGKPVYLLRTPEGITWIMQVYSKKVDKTLTLETLNQLGKKLQLPAGWAFETKVLEKDLALQPRWASGKAHIMWDDMGNAYQGCGFDKACAFIP